jgi:cell division protein ZipA
MNELQIVLIVLAIVVVVGLYFFQHKKENGSEDSSEEKSRLDADAALNELGDAHVPVSVPEMLEKSSSNTSNTSLEAETQSTESLNSVVPENQLGFSFDDEQTYHSSSSEANQNDPVHNDPNINIQQALLDEETIEQVQVEQDLDTRSQKETTEKRKPKHVVLEAEDIQETPSFDSSSASEQENKAPGFGIPAESPVENFKSKQVENIEPQVFALIVMGSEEFVMTRLNQTLHGVGLILSNSGIFVKKDTMGNEIIRVANLLEPGTFSLDQLEDENLTSAGVVLILELPTTVKAPAVMHDMILMARKISQRLNGRLYDMNRQLIKESDLQKMRDKAIEYETTAI